MTDIEKMHPYHSIQDLLMSYSEKEYSQPFIVSTMLYIKPNNQQGNLTLQSHHFTLRHGINNDYLTKENEATIQRILEKLDVEQAVRAYW